MCGLLLHRLSQRPVDAPIACPRCALRRAALQSACGRGAAARSVPCTLSDVHSTTHLTGRLSLMAAHVAAKTAPSAFKRILVTGGAGFLGSHLCTRLVGEGHDVICLYSELDRACLLAGHAWGLWPERRRGAACARCAPPRGARSLALTCSAIMDSVHRRGQPVHLTEGQHSAPDGLPEL